jgi:endonuclease/exonuclease/phosphatase family metal-dependent hydrolase
MSAPPLRVMTYNIGNGLAEPKRLAAYLRACAADVVGLQEVDRAQAAGLDAALADAYPHRALYGDGIPGKGLLSRLPVRSQTLLKLNPGRPDLYAVLDWRGGPLHVLIVHPPPPTPDVMAERQRQFARFAELVAAPEPVILMGDLNLIQFQQAYHALLAIGLRDAFANAGRGSARTFPRRRGRFPLIPLFRLDYILHSSELVARDGWVGEDAGSDHLPLLAEFA